MNKFLLVYVLLICTYSVVETAGPDFRSRDEVCNGNSPKNKFTVVDYAVVAGMLVISCAIGTFYGFFGEKQQTTNDFLLGGSKMSTFPMSLSLAASFITAVELLGNPAEMYKFGTQFWTICIAFLFVTPITTKFYLPIFMKLKLTSSFEYLEMRFNRYVRIFAALIYTIQMTLYTSVTVYAPAIALSHVTGMGVYLAVSVVYCVCIFYSSQGGMKAVIMTDTFQAAVLIISLILVVVLGQSLVGSVSDVVNVAYKSGRIELLKLNPSPTERHTIWTQVVGGIAYWIPMFCSNQASIQKYLSVETIKQVRIALWISAISLIVVYSINFYTGMIIFAQYYQCDPLLEHLGKPELRSKDEILPYYVMNVLGRYDGVPGLFVAGIFAASLGTVASALNSLAAITIKDFLDAGFNVKVAENNGAFLSKWISVIFGAISFLLIFIVKQMDSVLKAALTFNGIVGGINLGLFTLGMFLPWTTSKGALMGSAISLMFVSWLGINSQIAETAGYVSEFNKPVFYANCTDCPAFGPAPVEENLDIFVLFKISYMWYSAIGLIMTLLIGIAISWVTGFNDVSCVHPDLITPPMRRFYSKYFYNLDEKVPNLSTEKPEEIQCSHFSRADRKSFEKILDM